MNLESEEMGLQVSGQRDAIFLALKMENEDHEPRNLEMDSPLEPPRRNAALSIS